MSFETAASFFPITVLCRIISVACVKPEVKQKRRGSAPHFSSRSVFQKHAVDQLHHSSQLQARGQRVERKALTYTCTNDCQLPHVTLSIIIDELYSSRNHHVRACITTGRRSTGSNAVSQRRQPSQQPFPQFPPSEPLRCAAHKRRWRRVAILDARVTLAFDHTVAIQREPKSERRMECEA